MLSTCVEKGLLVPLDLYFARRMLKQGSEAQHALLAVLMACARQGHLCLPLDTLEELLSAMNGSIECDLSALAKLVRQGADPLPETPVLVEQSGCFYLQRFWQIETQIVERIQKLLQTSPKLTLPALQMPGSLNSAQQNALAQAWTHALSLLCGGPGTGKTYTAAALVKAVLDSHSQARIIVAAPTGKAVAQIEAYLKRVLPAEANLRAATLHALLELKGEDDMEREPKPIFADLILVDESSMIDAELFTHFLQAVVPGTRLVLIGDPDQLPPIEMGSVFGDLTHANLPMTELAESLRSDRLEIHAMAAAIRTGQLADVLTSSKHVQWLDWSLEGRPAKFYAQLLSVVQDRFTSGFDQEPQPYLLMCSLDHFRLLSCMRRGPYGVDAVNTYLMQKLLEACAQSPWWVAPILITRNHRETDLFNGESGFLIRKQTSSTRFEDYALFADRKEPGAYRKIPAGALPAFEYSYCLSVHKSQGSEYDDVLVLVPPGTEVFGREVLYTAVTRARKALLMAGSSKTVERTLQHTSQRRSRIVERLKNGVD